MAKTEPYPVEQPWARSAEALLQKMSIDAHRGLDARRVAKLRRRYGANRLQAAKRRSAAAIFVDQVRNLIVLLLGTAAGVSFVFGQQLEALAIAVAIGVNVAIGFFTELRATRSMEALQRLNRVDANVRRDGREQTIAAQELVPGDMVLLSAGDVIGADLRIIQADRLAVDESALTGESVPVDKRTEPVDPQAPLAERASMLHKGTAVTRGTGTGVVVAVGMATELGRIAALTQSADSADTPLEKKLQQLGYRLIWLTLGIAALVTAVGILAGKEFRMMLETAIALAVAAAPEGLPVVATIGLARGVWRMLNANALISRLSAVETLGSTTVIFTDKTGTLTENRMTVQKVATAGGAADGPRVFDLKSDGAHFSGEASVEKEGDPATLLAAVLKIGVLCNNARLDDTGADDGEGVGDPMEIALLSAGRRMGWERKELTAGQPEVLEVAFDRDTQMMATVHADGDRYLTAVKGAPEAVLAVSSHISGADGPTAMGSAQRRQWRRQSDTFARDGLRVLALASKPQVDPDSDPYGDLVFRGLVALEDPPRRGVADAVGACKGAGTAVAMVTGDHPDTAASIAARVGIADRDAAEAVTGAELQTLSGEAGRPPRDVLDTRVFARVSPKQKLDLIALHQAHGAVVAMTGDGVNDAPALKKADIGIAMGHRGTQVAKEAADMVLQDDAFGTIVSAIAQGRAIFANIRKFILFLLSGNVGEILIVAIAILTGAPLPLLPLQILYLNMIGDVFPALAMAAGDGDDARMQAPPRDQKEAILTRRHWLAVGLYGGVIAVAALAAFWTALHLLGYDTARAVTISFLTLSFARLWHVFNMRSAGTRLLDNDIVRNPFIWGALALCTALLLMAVYLPALPQLLKLVRPTGFDWGIILGFSTLPLVIGQLLLPLVNRD